MDKVALTPHQDFRLRYNSMGVKPPSPMVKEVLENKHGIDNPVIDLNVSNDFATILQSVQNDDIAGATGPEDFSFNDAPGLYRISYYVVVTTKDPAAGLMTLHFDWTDDSGARSQGPVSVGLAGLNEASGSLVVRLSEGSISFRTTVSTSFGSALYSLYLTLERLE